MNQKYKIGFFLIDEHSSFNAAFGLARVFEERGHKVMFFVKAETVFPQYVGDNGFESVILETNEIYQALDQQKNKAKFRPWKRLKIHARRVRLEQKCLSDLIEKRSLDLCFLDNIYFYPYSLILAGMRVPTILFFPNFGSKLSSWYPPLFSYMIPPQSKSANIRIRFVYSILWVWAVTTRGRAHSYDFLESVHFTLGRIFFRIYQIGFERKLRKSGWKSTWSEWSTRPLVLEIVLGHRSLDWQTVASNPERFYFGTTDLYRKNSGFDWSEIKSKNPIIYCNISTAHGFEQTKISEPEILSSKIDFSKKITWQNNFSKSY